MHWIHLAIAIVCEVVATSALKGSEGFTRAWPSAVVVVGYATAFFFLGLSLRSLPVGVAYALWAALGMALITLSGWWVFGERLDRWALAGIALIIAGVVLITAVSDTLGGAEERAGRQGAPGDGPRVGLHHE